MVAAAVIVLSAAPARGDTTLIPEGDTGWRYHVVELPTAPKDDPLVRAAVLGAATVSSVASTVAGQGRSPAWTLQAAPDGPDDGWREAGAAPFGSIVDPAKCKCATQVLPGVLQRIAAVRFRRSFTVTPKLLASTRALTVRMRYTDGIVVYLNGVAIAQRLMAPTGPLDAGAIGTHGSEWETFSVPLLPWLLSTDGNVLAVEVRPYEERPVLFDLALSASAGPRVLVGPYLREVEPTRATVIVETDIPTVAEARWGATDAYGQSVRSGDPLPSRHHELALDGLAAGENHYRVVLYAAGAPASVVAVPSVDTGDAVLTTPPAFDEPVRLVVYGDVRNGHATHARLLEGIRGHGVDFVLTTGDMVARGHDEGDWQRYFGLTGDFLRSTPMYPAIGNHEVGSGAMGVLRFRQFFAKGAPADDVLAGWYSTDVGGVHIVFLDSNRYDAPQQLVWLDRDLAAARKRGSRAIFAVTHDGPASRASHGPNQEALTKYVPVLQKHKVAVIFGGHDHAYERGFLGKLQYVVSGGGGAPLYPEECGKKGQHACNKAVAFASENHYVLVEVMRDFFTMCPYRMDGTTIEQCVTTKLPRK